MIGELIKEYLVGLGVQIDKPGFAEMESTINKTSNTIGNATGGWAKNFMSAGAIVATAVASVTASVAGLMVAVSKQDLAMEKYSRQMLVSKSAALEMKQAIDALGESVQDIQITPELFERYKSLVKDGRNMKVGGDYAETMKGFRDLIFEFTRLKQEASYALQWVGYYLVKYLKKPLDDAKQTFRTLNDSLIKNMPVWTDKIARALVYVINIGLHFWDLLKAIGRTVADVWDNFPRGVKIATAALTTFFIALQASPLTRFVMLIGSLLLLVDDYFGYMEGKQAALGGVWDKLNSCIDLVKTSLTKFGNELSPIWDKFIQYMSEAKDGLINLSAKFAECLSEIHGSKEFSNFLDAVQRLGSALCDLGDGIINAAVGGIKMLMEAFDKHDSAASFTMLLKEIVDVFAAIIDAIAYCCEGIGDWLYEIGKSEVVRDFIDALVELVSVIFEGIKVFSEFCSVVLKEFFNGMGKTQPVNSFKDAIIAVVKAITAMLRGVKDLFKGLIELYKIMKDNRVFKAFWSGIGEVVGTVFKIIMKALGATGKLGQALLSLVKGDWKGAKNVAGAAIDMLFGSSKAEASGRNGFKGTGDAERDAIILEASKKYGVPANKIAGMMKAESSFDPNVVSGAGAMGYMQLMPATFAGLGFDPDNIFDPYDNIMAGTKYMAELYERFQNWEDVYAAYNMGPNGYANYLEKDSNDRSKLSEETFNHIDRVKRYSEEFSMEDDSPYTIQADVEDEDLSNTDPAFKNTFDQFAKRLNDQGYELEVSSGWRSSENNASVNGVENSKHLSGEAIDFIIKGDYDQAQIEELAERYGMRVIYHNVGSGLHFHVQPDADMPNYEFRNPSGEEREITLYDRVKERASQVYDEITDWVGNTWDGISEYFTPTAYSDGGVDPIMLNGLMQQRQTYGSVLQSSFGGGTTIINQVTIGDINIAETNATAEEIGQTVAKTTVDSLSEQAEYIKQNRTVGGDVAWV